ncbi:MAG: metalloregulator ArsR/SmtB family transcription factor [Chloroflexota bacterium]
MEIELVKELNLLHEQVCDALGSPIRLMIFYALSDKPRYVTDLAEELNLPQSTISRHLRVLRERGLVTAQREGPAVYYSLADQRVLQALELMRTVLHDRLQRQLEITGKLN